MQGIVSKVSRDGVWALILHQHGKSLVQLIGSEGALSVGDTVAGELTVLGSTTLRNGKDVLDAWVDEIQ